MTYANQLAELMPPVWVPPTTGAITGALNSGLPPGKSAAWWCTW